MPNGDDDSLISLLFFLVVVFFVLLMVAWFGDNQPRQGYFYVGSNDQGYSVNMDSFAGKTTKITKTNLSLDKAKQLADQLNKALEGSENK